MTDNSQADTIHNMMRNVLAMFNLGLYSLLAIMYQIFFNVSSAQLFENETIKNFYARIQLIIGVYMIFKLAITVLQGIMDPDKFTNPKEGIGNVITRIITALAMLTLLVPISIPNATNSFEVYINNNGLLFGTLYSLQDRILTGNTLGRLILGTTDDNTVPSSSQNDSNDGLTEAEKQEEKLKSSARVFSSTILKGFLRINLLPEEVEARTSDDETKRENRYCQTDGSDDVITTYKQLDVSPAVLLSPDIITASCEINDSFLNTVGNILNFIPIISDWAGKSRYVFNFDGLWSLVVGLIFLVILIGFTVDIAIRSIKLSILRLLAPIPIISYIEPKSSKDGAFASWVKALTSTYLDLFLRLGIVYFVIFLIQDMIVNGIIINNGSGIVGIMSAIFIWIGLFFFAKMAPKFIKEALGLKGSMSNVGLSGILGGAAMLAGGGGLKGAALGVMQGTDAAVQGYNQGKPQSLGAAWSQNRDLMAKIRTGDKDARGGIMGSTMDRLNYQSRERRAKILGIGNQDLADADYLQKVRKAEASATKRDLDFAEAKYKRGEIDAAQYQAAYDRNDDYQTKAAKAAAAYDKMDKDRALMGATPRVIDKRDRKYKMVQRFNRSFGTELPETKAQFTDSVNRGLGVEDNQHLKFQPGSYRSPSKTKVDGYDPTQQDVSGAPRSDKDIINQVKGHERDLKGFNGTTDDEGIFSR